MRLLAAHRFKNHRYMVKDREVNRLNQLISFYHSSWSNIPDFEKIRVEDMNTHEMIEVQVRDLVFQREEA